MKEALLKPFKLHIVMDYIGSFVVNVASIDMIGFAVQDVAVAVAGGCIEPSKPTEPSVNPFEAAV